MGEIIEKFLLLSFCGMLKCELFERKRERRERKREREEKERKKER